MSTNAASSTSDLAPVSDASNFGFGPPVQIASFSRDARGNTTYDDRSLSYFVTPQIGSNMFEGFEHFLRANRNHRFVGHPRRLDEIVHSALLTDAKYLRDAHVVTWRGILTRIMLGVPLSLNMSFINGTLFLEEHDPKPHARGHQLTKPSYPGYRFEAICTSKSPDVTQSDSNAIPDLSMWCSLATSTVGELKLLYAGEVDCVQSGYTLGDADKFVELKSASRTPDTKTKKKWFLQSFLLGTQHLYIGYRDQAGRLESTSHFTLEQFRIQYLPSWDIEDCLRRGTELLERLRAFGVEQTNVLAADEMSKKVWRVDIKNVQGNIVEMFDELDQRELDALRRRHGASHRCGILLEEHIQRWQGAGL